MKIINSGAWPVNMWAKHHRLVTDVASTEQMKCVTIQPVDLSESYTSLSDNVTIVLRDKKYSPTIKHLILE